MILATLHGAYPQVYLDEAVVEVWTNVMSTVDYGVAQKAVQEWITQQTKFPTVAELTGTIRRINNPDAPAALPASPHVADKNRAQAAFAAGYERARKEAGDSQDDIDRKLDVLLNNWAGILPKRSTDRERHARVRSIRWASAP
jgi:hypothetical protein